MNRMTAKALQYANEFVGFLNSSPTPYHAVGSVKARLGAHGFVELSERDAWHIQPGGRYYVTRNGSSIIAFAVGEQWQPGNAVAMVGAHTDSPTLRLKPVSRRSAEGYIQVGVETYGGGIWHSWFDSDLSVAGRVMVRAEGRFVSKLVDIKRPVLKIPTLAIHLDRDVNTKFEFNRETQLLPVAGLDNAVPCAERAGSGKTAAPQAAQADQAAPQAAQAAQAAPQADQAETPGCCAGSTPAGDEFQSLKSLVERHNSQLLALVAREAGVPPDHIEDFELILYDHKPATIGGLNDEFIFSGRLDNLTSCYTSTEGLIQSAQHLDGETGIRLISLFDHEEIGSSSAQGADSNFLPNVLERLNGAKLHQAAARSFFLSCDVAHGVHPNYAAKYESKHKPNLGEGPVIKINASQRYMTNSPGIVLLKQLANIAKVPLQLFVVANNSPCGSTIGPILASKTGIRTLDLGNGILSMHSIRETGSSYDIEKAIKLYVSYFDNFSTIEPKIEV